MIPKIIMTDIDGVWTDGGMYYDNKGNELKKFNTADSAGVLICKKLHIPIVIITGEKTKIVKKRSRKLKIEFLFQGIDNKLPVAEKVCKNLHIDLRDAAYIGDDIGDIELLKKVGYSATPANGIPFLKKNVNFVTSKKGGEGAFREFVENIFCDQLDDLFDFQDWGEACLKKEK